MANVLYVIPWSSLKRKLEYAMPVPMVIWENDVLFAVLISVRMQSLDRPLITVKNASFKKNIEKVVQGLRTWAVLKQT